MSTRSELDQILGDRAVRSVYQPIVDLETGAIVGVEALARGPEGSELERPDLLFREARRRGRLVELDMACRSAALRGALEGDLSEDRTLFVNVEPSTAHVVPDAELMELIDAASSAFPIVVEITERSLVSHPAELLGALDKMRSTGAGIAIDDVGAEIASLALMPLLRPDVVKLDLSLVQQQPDQTVAEIVGAVAAHTERTGATVLAEGIENEDQALVARSLGATLGQGWHFGRPGPLHDVIGRGACPYPLERVRPRPSAPVSPFEAACGDGPVRPRRSTKRLLLEMSWHLERQASSLGPHGVTIGTFQTADRFTPATACRYTGLAEQSAFVGALGAGLALEPAPGVRGGDIALDDPLIDEWVVAVVGPHFSGALAALDLHDSGPDDERRFDYVITYERDRVLAVAETLMNRIVATAP